MTAIKFCGITNQEDAVEAVRLGVEYLGFNFYEKSKRFISPENAQTISRLLPANIHRVGVFVDAAVEYVERCARMASLGFLQFHGSESADYCRQWKSWKVIKAFRVSSPGTSALLSEFSEAADHLLFDAFHPSEFGGTGNLMSDEILESLASQSAFSRGFLAGGLTEKNVNDLVVRFKPFAVDVASGIESAPGKKDPEKMKAFIHAVRGS